MADTFLSSVGLPGMNFGAIGFDQETLGKLITFVLLLLSLTFHEYGHAWTARQLGDDTAEQLGRLSLNPMRHADPVFTILLPLMFLFSPNPSGIFFGAAKPVPVNPYRMRHPLRDMMLTSAAGPAMNVLLALFFTAAYWFHVEVRGIEWHATSSLFILGAIQLNLGLAVFNMLPVPPLDGHRVLGYFLPAKLREGYYRIGSLGMLVLLVAMLTGMLGRVMERILLPLGQAWAHLMPPDTPQLFGY